LCSAGLVRREDDPEDRRAKIIAVTAQGRAVTSKMEEDLVGLRADVLKGISRADLQATLRVLEAFNASEAAGTANRKNME
jgi:MarR family transcriptional regulator, transcriptional regulator for hemolysin